MSAFALSLNLFDNLSLSLVLSLSQCRTYLARAHVRGSQYVDMVGCYLGFTIKPRRNAAETLVVALP